MAPDFAFGPSLFSSDSHASARRPDAGQHDGQLHEHLPDRGHPWPVEGKGKVLLCHHGAAVVQEVEKSFSNQMVASSIPCRSVLEQGTEPLIAPDVQCAISVNVKM